MNKQEKNQQKISSKTNDLSNYLVLLMFGVVYNELIERLEEQSDSDMLTSLTVAFGVGMTLLLIVPILGWRIVTKIFLAFTASGLPMIFGHLARWHQRGRVLSANSTEEGTRSRR